MKYLKILGFAAVAVAALMAFAGAGTASADEICTENINPCPVAKRITTLVYSLSKNTTLEDTSANPLFSCTAGKLNEDITAQGIGISIAKVATIFTLSCGGTVDTVRVGSGEINNNGSSNGTDVDLHTEITSINFGVSCTFGTGTGTDRGTLKGGAGAKLEINAVVQKTAGSFLCPSTTRWTGEFVLINHAAAFVINN